MKTLRLIVVVVSTLIIIAFLFIFDYTDPLSGRNTIAILGILAAVFNLLAMFFTRPEKRNSG